MELLAQKLYFATLTIRPRDDLVVKIDLNQFLISRPRWRSSYKIRVSSNVLTC